MTGAKIAVAGGTGFIGRHLVARLLARGCEVVVLARSRRPLTGALAGAELRSLDLGGDALDASALAGCGLVVNLVGIKREAKGQSWDAIHIDLPRRLAAAAVDAGIPRMIHVSVAGADRAGPDAGPYLRSKAEGEAALREVEGLALTILRPGVVYGRGDDMLRNLADSIRAAPLFPAPRGGRSPIQPVHVEDLAEAVLRCIETPASAGRDYEIVGPERLELRELVARVAGHPRVDRACVVVPTPAVLQRLAAAVFERSSADPLITRSQLELLERGVVGDPQPARDELGLEPRALDDAAIDDALREFSPRLPSLRLVPDPAAAAELAAIAGDSSSARSWIFAVIAVALLLAGPWLLAPWSGSIWLRMAGSELLLSALALSVLGLRWRELLRPRADALVWGLGAGVVMWAGAFVVAAVLSRIAPQLWAETASLYAWADELPRASALALLGVIVAGEEIVWRGALGVGLASRGRLGPWLAVLASAGLFTIAHLSSGPPVLAIAAALAGAAWAALAIRTRSLFATFVAHLLWDVTMLWLTPL